MHTMCFCSSCTECYTYSPIGVSTIWTGAVHLELASSRLELMLVSEPYIPADMVLVERIYVQECSLATCLWGKEELHTIKGVPQEYNTTDTFPDSTGYEPCSIKSIKLQIYFPVVGTTSLTASRVPRNNMCPDAEFPPLRNRYHIADLCAGQHRYVHQLLPY